MDNVKKSFDNDKLENQYKDYSVKKNNISLFSASTFTESLLFTALITYLSFAFVKKLTPIFLANPWLNGLIIVLTIVAVIYTFISIAKIKNAENIFRYLTKPAGYDEDRFGDKSTLINEDIHVFFSLTQNVTTHRGKRLSAKLISNIYNMRAPLKYLGSLVLALGLLGTFWGLLQALMAAPNVMQGDAVNSNMQGLFSAMSIAFGSSLFGIVGRIFVGFYDWRLGALAEKLSYLIEGQFQKRVEKISLSSDNDSDAPLMLYNDKSDNFSKDALAYRKLIELTDQVSSLKSHFFAPSNNNQAEQNSIIEKVDSCLEKHQDSLKDIVSELSETVKQSSQRFEVASQRTDNILPTLVQCLQDVENDLKVRDQGLSKQFTDQINKVNQKIDIKDKALYSELIEKFNAASHNSENNNLNKEVIEKLEKIETVQNQKFSEEIGSIIVETKNLTQQNDLLKKDIKSLRHAHLDQSHQLKSFLSDELKKIKIDRTKPLMFMPVEASLED